MIDLDHVALATRDVADALDALVGELGGLVIFGGNNVGFRAVQVRLGDRADEGLNVELLEPWEVDAHDFLARFVDRHGDGPHHLTFKVDDLERKLEEIDALGLRPTSVDLTSPNWKEAFLHQDAHGTVVQLAESHGMPSREEMLEQVRSSGPAGHPRWWPDPPPRVARAPLLRRVVMRTPSLPDAAGLFTGLLGGRRVHAGEGWLELVWPGGGRLALEHRPGTDPGVDRVEVEVSGPGLLGERSVAGTRFVVNARD